MKKLFKLLLSALALLFLGCAVILFIGNRNIDPLPVSLKKDHLRIVSMNVSADNILTDFLQNNLLKTSPDIIVIIEWTGNNVNLKRFEEEGYTAVLNHPRKKVHGLCILSRLKGDVAIIEAPIKTPCTLPLGQLRFKWKETFITLFAIHAPPPVSSCNGTTTPYLKHISGWIQNGKLCTDIGAGKSGDNVILAGDFNCIPTDEGIEIFRNKHLKDGYSTYSVTSPTWKPFPFSPYLVKIDYLFFSDTFIPTTNERFRIEHSDHIGLITDLSMAP